MSENLQKGTMSTDPAWTPLESVGFDGTTTIPRWTAEIFVLGLKQDELCCVYKEAGMTWDKNDFHVGCTMRKKHERVLLWSNPTVTVLTSKPLMDKHLSMFCILVPSF